MFFICLAATTMLQVVWDVKIKSIRCWQMNECQNGPWGRRADNCWPLCPRRAEMLIRGLFSLCALCTTQKVKCTSVTGSFLCFSLSLSSSISSFFFFLERSGVFLDILWLVGFCCGVFSSHFARLWLKGRGGEEDTGQGPCGLMRYIDLYLNSYFINS